MRIGLIPFVSGVSWQPRSDSRHLALPKSSAFKLSYLSAYFILAVRSLEGFGNGTSPEVLLSPQHVDRQPEAEKREGDQPRYQAHALQFAVQILETFLEMSASLRNEIPIYLHMCISYSALVIAQYWRKSMDTNTGSSSATTVLELLNALEDWCTTCPSMSLVTSYSTGLAKRRVQSCIGIDHPPHRHQPSYGVGAGQGVSASRSPLFSAAEGLLGLGSTPIADHDMSAHSSMDHIVDMPDLGLSPGFPSIEDFFGGGFLDFIR